jgi:short-subunit dehydrogenase
VKNLNNMVELKNKNALITGASSGIGEAIVNSLAEKGVNLCLIGRNVKKLTQIKERFKSLSIKIELYEADLSKEEELKGIADFFTSNFSTLDILIHSAGIISTGSTEQAPVIDLKLHLNINYVAPYIITQSLLPVMRKSKGQIVFVNSSAIQRPIGNLGQYSSSKYALKGLADSLREEINADGIRVTSIYPGKTASVMQKRLYHESNKPYQPEKLLQPEDIAITIRNILQLPMTAEITEIFIRPMQKS